MLNNLKLTNLKKQAHVLFGMAAFVASGAAFAQTTLPGDLPQINTNQPAVIAPAQFPDLWAQDVQNRFDFDARQALVYPGAKILKAQKWDLAFQNLLAGASDPRQQLSLIYRIANRTLEITHALNELAVREINDGPADYQIGQNRAYMPMILVYEHNYRLIKSLIDFDRKYFANALRGNRIDQNQDDLGLVGSSPADLQNLEQGLRAYAIEQIKWVQTDFITRLPEAGAIPNYSYDAYFAVLKEVLKGIVKDLTGQVAGGASSLFPTSFAASVSKMNLLIYQMDAHAVDNSFSSSIYLTFQLVQGFVYDVLESLSCGK